MSTDESVSRRTYGRGPSRLDPIAPDWLVRIFAPKKASVPWLDMVRVCLTVTVPMGVGVGLGQPELGILAGMGSLVGAFGDKGGPFRERFRRTGAGTVAALTGLLIGRMIEEQAGWAVITVAALAALSALLSSISANLSFAGLQLLIYVAVAGAFAGGLALPLLLGCFTAGIGWALVLSRIQCWVEPPTDRPRAAEVQVLRELALVLRQDADAATAGEQAGPPVRSATDLDVANERRRITRDIARAYDDLVTARSSSAGSRRDLRRLAAALTSTFGLVGASFDYLSQGGRHGVQVAAVLGELADLVESEDASLTRQRLPALRDRTAVLVAAHRDLRPVGDALVQVSQTLTEPRPRPTAPATGEPTQVWLFGTKTWTFAARLALTLAVAQTVASSVPVEKPYWIVLTAAIVLKPDLGSVFARGVQRTIGTLAGVLLGVLILQLIPPGGWLLLPMAVLAFGFPFGASRNYGLLATLVTPLVLLLLDFGAGVDDRLAWDRLLDTGIGAAIVLVVGYLCWPSTWRPRLGERIAAGVETLGSYARVAFGADNQSAGVQRRRSYRAMSDVRADLQSTLAEPPPLSSQAAAWWPLIAQLEKTTDDLSDASLLARHHGQRPSSADVAQLVAGFDDLAAALRGHREPRALPDPRSPLLADLAADLRGLRRIAVGPIGA